MFLQNSISVIGHVKIFDSNKIYVENFNHINVRNIATLIGRGLVNLGNSSVFTLKVGNGGIAQDGSFKQLKISQVDTDLYSPINASSIILDSSDDNHTEGSSIVMTLSGGGTVSIVCSAVISRSGSETTPLVINELGLFGKGGLMLSHLIFSPVSILPGSNKNVAYTVSFDISGT